MSEIIHYFDPQSRGMRSQRVLEAFDIPHKSVLVDIRKGDHKKPDYGLIHPWDQQPGFGPRGE